MKLNRKDNQKLFQDNFQIRKTEKSRKNMIANGNEGEILMEDEFIVRILTNYPR